MLPETKIKTSYTNSEGLDACPAIKYTVGFTKFHLVDASRKERFSSDANRQFEILVWYPGADGPCKPKEYLAEREAGKLIHLNFNFGRKTVKNSILPIETNSFPEIPVSDKRDKYPVLLFSHDLGMLPEYYTRLMEHLASRGYFIFSINHPYLSEACPLERGSSQHSRTIRLKKRLALRSLYLTRRTRKKIVGQPHGIKWTISKKIMSEWNVLSAVNSDTVADRRFLLDFLSRLDDRFVNGNPPYNIFYNRLDLTRIGVAGHGWGGSSAVESLMKDGRIKVAVNLDGFQFGSVVNNILSKPLLMLYSGKNTGINEGIYFSSSHYETHTIENAGHDTFSDWPYLKKQDVASDNKSLQEILTLTERFLNSYLVTFSHMSSVHLKN